MSNENDNLGSVLESSVVHAQAELEGIGYDVNGETIEKILACLDAALSRLNYVSGELRRAFPDQK